MFRLNIDFDVTIWIICLSNIYNCQNSELMGTRSPIRTPKCLLEHQLLTFLTFFYFLLYPLLLIDVWLNYFFPCVRLCNFFFKICLERKNLNVFCYLFIYWTNGSPIYITHSVKYFNISLFHLNRLLTQLHWHNNN